MSRIARVILILFACATAWCAFSPTFAQAGQTGPWNPGNPPGIEANPDPDPPTGGPTLACVGNPMEALPAGALAVVTATTSLACGSVLVEIWNAVDKQIAYLTLDGFDAQGVQGLHFDSVCVLRQPQNGLAQVQYPVAGTDGIGPAVLAFEDGGLSQSDCAAFELRVGSWDQHKFHAQVVDLVDTQIRVVFDDGLRGSGMLQLCPQTARIQVPSVGKIVCRPGDAVGVIAEHRTVTQ